MAMQVLAVASELYPLIKTGGLADVAGALPAALGGHYVSVRTIIPGYRDVLSKIGRVDVRHQLGDLFGERAELLEWRAEGGEEILVLEAPHLFNRDGGPYVDPAGQDWSDNAIRFAALSRAAERVARGLISDWVPDVVHAHDWQAGLTPAYLALAGEPRPRTVMTIHNLAFQGQCGAELLGALGLPLEAYAVDGVEYYGAVGFLKAGIFYADHVTTVSPTYASEIQLPGAGMGLDGLLATRAAEGRLSGILNGIDTQTWDPSSDPHLAATYSAHSLDLKAANKAALQQRLGLEVSPTRPVFAVITRLTWQKGMDLLLEAIPELIARGGQLALLGAGEPAIQEGLLAIEATDPGSIGCVFGYDEPLAHLLQGGADAILVPSRFEPCGLTQLCALRYGTIPVVSRLGGLADTVIDANDAALRAGVATGVQFAPVDQRGLVLAIDRTIRLYQQPDSWRTLQRQGMASSIGWEQAAGLYAALYHRLIRGDI